MKIIKKIAAAIAAAAVLTASGSAVFARTYSDVPPTHWAYGAVETCSAAHWFDGYADGTFRPNGEILRGEAIKVFVQILGLPLSTVTNPTYYDSTVDKWYTPYVEAGKYLFPEMTAPDGRKKFQPEMPITREVAIYALVKTLGYDTEIKFVDESKLNMFSDQRSISTNIRPYMAWAINDGLASGYDDGTIGAQEPLTRAEFATILRRAHDTHGFNNTGYVAKVVSGVTISPNTMKQITVGESFEISGTVSYSDGTSEDCTQNLNPYTNSADGIVVINKNKITAVGEGSAVIEFNNPDMGDIQLVVIVSKPADAPVITLNAPAAETESETVSITGTVTDATGTALTLTVNGSPAALLTDGSFSSEVKLAEGTNNIVISAKNAYGNESTQTVTVEKKTPQPTEAPTETPAADTSAE